MAALHLKLLFYIICVINMLDLRGPCKTSKGWSLKFANFTGDSGLYLWKEQEFKKFEEVWPTLFLWGVILLQLFRIPAPFREIGRCRLWNWQILMTSLYFVPFLLLYSYFSVFCPFSIFDASLLLFNVCDFGTNPIS